MPLKLFYYCYGGAHTSVTCASIHLGFLPRDRLPASSAFLSVPFYDKMDNDKLGIPMYMGRDKLGWDIYFMGLKNSKALSLPALRSFLNAFGVPQRQVFFVNALAELHPITSIGGFTSRKLGGVFIGRPMTIWGVRKSYAKFVDLVERVERTLALYASDCT